MIPSPPPPSLPMAPVPGTAPMATQLPGELLAQLRDIHMPPPVSDWPPAFGWWGVLGLLLLLALGGMLWRRHWNRRRPVREALVALDELLVSYGRDGDGGRFVRGLSILLKRVALAVHGRERVAALNGAAWLAFLDQTGGRGGFSEGVGQVLAVGPYRPGEAVEVIPLAELARSWIRQAKPPRPSPSSSPSSRSAGFWRFVPVARVFGRGG
ncbi:MAG: DUF4381 domain-containing protein [Magnetococcales bacterium]|nr:DUF4381 domain-containing protein [Magnetococcales bacterium]